MDKIRLEKHIESLKRDKNHLQSDYEKVSSPTSKRLINNEIEFIERSIERKEFKLWKLEK